ncbi:MAG TPA: hypothetical protein VHG09_14575 [Longimicrobiales bacterium]|nr:hypothetical protein [Longimicrobiales bacterium]
MTLRPTPLFLAAALLTGAGFMFHDDAAARWGLHGHEISGRAAATNLPAGLPEFFRRSTEHLAYLNPEPDRWRGDNARELNEAMRYDHYVDFEVIPEEVLGATDRFQYLMALQDAGLSNPARDAGLLPFRIVELYQRLVIEWRLWRAETDPAKRRMIEDRIINDAGILGHYVTDAANPHHTSVHHNRWAEGYANPRGFTTEPGFHSRFESQYVGANITAADLVPHMNARPRTLSDIRIEVMAHLQRTHSRLERLYELDQQERWTAETSGPEHREFAIERLVAGANMLRDVWWSAWVESSRPEPEQR